MQVQEQSLNSFINIPWRDEDPSYQGCRCWGLIQLYYDAIKNVKLPDLLAMPSCMHEWRPVSLVEIAVGDVLVFRISKNEHHVGVAVSQQKMLHVEQGATSCIENYRGIKWKDRFLKAYHYIQ